MVFESRSTSRLEAQAELRAQPEEVELLELDTAGVLAAFAAEGEPGVERPHILRGDFRRRRRRHGTTPGGSARRAGSAYRAGCAPTHRSSPGPIRSPLVNSSWSMMVASRVAMCSRLAVRDSAVSLVRDSRRRTAGARSDGCSRCARRCSPARRPMAGPRRAAVRAASVRALALGSRRAQVTAWRAGGCQAVLLTPAISRAWRGDNRTMRR